VYIEELPSGVRTITGVATSITAFIGRARRGPVDEPTVINSFADFERRFGGMWVDSTMSYAVRDFYMNGGSQAVIVRVHNGATVARISLTTGGSPPNDFLLLDAASPGAWGGELSAAVDYKTEDPMDSSVTRNPNIFNLTIFEGGTKVESHLNVTLNADDARYLPRVLEQSSAVIRVPKDSSDNWIVPATLPEETVVTSPPSDPPTEPPSVKASSSSDGSDIRTEELTGSSSNKTGLYALDKADLFNLLCIPPPTRPTDTNPTVYQAAMRYCVDRRAMLIVDPPLAWGASPGDATSPAISGLNTLGLSGKEARNAALYFPRVRQADPEREGQSDTFVPCGIVAGIMARTDTQRGVWKAPAGLDAAMGGIQGLQVSMTDAENGQLNQLGVNCLRSFPVNGRVVWGARTMRGANQLADEYKYVPVRRTAPLSWHTVGGIRTQR
jgi:phage tail sheath protein FI